MDDHYAVEFKFFKKSFRTSNKIYYSGIINEFLGRGKNNKISDRNLQSSKRVSTKKILSMNVLMKETKLVIRLGSVSHPTIIANKLYIVYISLCK